MNILTKEKENNTMQNITENLTKLISQITQMEKDNLKLNEDIREIEKEKAEGYKTFNTETHILVEREKLESVIDIADEIYSNSDYTGDEIDRAQSAINDAKYNSDDIGSQARDVSRDLEAILKPKEEETEQSD